MLDLIVRAAVGGPCVGPYSPCGCGRSMCWTLWSVRLWEVHVLDLIVRAAVGGPCVGPYGPCGCGRSQSVRED